MGNEFVLNESTLEFYKKYDSNLFEIARISSCYRNVFKVWTTDGEKLAKVSGKFSFQVVSEEDMPVVGDWVITSKSNLQDEAVIHEILPRTSKLSRAKAGTEFGEQIIAANVDYCLIVMALNLDFNIRRLERYLTAVWDSGATPIIVLNKADLCNDLDEKMKAVEAISFGTQIIITSATDLEKMKNLQSLLLKNKTYVLVGSSGVGKSTITNFLLGRDVQETTDIRFGDDKGKHCTTTRDLYYSEFGYCVIDTPGMREFALFGSEEGVSTSFKEITELALQCRFTDCTHKNEPGCAIQNALRNGSLTQERYTSYLKLLREEAYSLRKNDAKLMAEEKKKWKQISKAQYSQISKKR
ncbi:MAG: ribosome small subunit-dependent GTPase [Bacillales bacterium]|nr:ribosome small subunit-dependent GTPase [Bacillales bacterium]